MHPRSCRGLPFFPLLFFFFFFLASKMEDVGSRTRTCFKVRPLIFSSPPFFPFRARGAASATGRHRGRPRSNFPFLPPPLFPPPFWVVSFAVVRLLGRNENGRARRLVFPPPSWSCGTGWGTALAFFPPPSFFGPGWGARRTRIAVSWRSGGPPLPPSFVFFFLSPLHDGELAPASRPGFSSFPPSPTGRTQRAY